MTIAALYVDPGGPYASMPGVDCWDAERDATRYMGPHPFVGHPPCGHWGRMSPHERRPGKLLGPLAVQQLHRFGGVIEHPCGSRLWAHCGLPSPFRSVPAIAPPVWSLVVEQCRWGHRARKRTWLLFCGVRPADLPRIPERRKPTHVVTSSLRKSDPRRLPNLPSGETHLTPPLFAEWLVQCVRNYRARLLEAA